MSSILSDMSDPSPLSFPDYDQLASDHADDGPPEGLEVGYVPIVVRQSAASTRDR